MSLHEEKIAAVDEATPAIAENEMSACLQALHEDWKVLDGKKIQREFVLKDFVEALDLVNKIGAIAEAANHHPDIHMRNWNHVIIELWTHTIQGLSKNDFIVAARIDGMA